MIIYVLNMNRFDFRVINFANLQSLLGKEDYILEIIKIDGR